MHRSSFIHDNLATIVAALLVAVALVVLVLWQRSLNGSGRMVARVHDGDGKVHELPLDADATLEVSTELGHNTIVVEEGSARVSDADCPNGTCMRERPISQPGQQIICLPHQLWIEVVPEGAESGHMDVSLVEDGDHDVDLVAR